MDWDKLKTLKIVVDERSFTEAAKKLSLNQSSVSRQVAAVEEALQVKLFVRKGQEIQPTEYAYIVTDCVNNMAREITLMHERIDRNNQVIKGSIRILTTTSLADIWLVNHVAEFMHRYPHVDLRLAGGNHKFEFSASEVEIGLIPRKPTEEDDRFIHKFLMEWDLALFASKEYLDKRGVPTTLDELKTHRFLGFGEDFERPYPGVNWIFNQFGKDPISSICMNSSYGLFKAAKAGLGIISFSRQSILLKDSGLVRVLPELKGPKIPVYMVYLKAYQNIERLGVLQSYLLEMVDKHHHIII